MGADDVVVVDGNEPKEIGVVVAFGSAASEGPAWLVPVVAGGAIEPEVVDAAVILEDGPGPALAKLKLREIFSPSFFSNPRLWAVSSAASACIFALAI